MFGDKDLVDECSTLKNTGCLVLGVSTVHLYHKCNV